MFIGRHQELAAMEKRYAGTRFEFLVIYGRRRVGKTRLIREFIRDKNAVYFMATEQSEKEQLINLTAALREQLPDPRTQFLPQFASFEDLFSYLAEAASRQRLVFVIDEYPYLARAVPGISSILQKYIDNAWGTTGLYLILCGSSMSFMERQVLSYQSPLYGRRTAQIKLHPLPFYESMRFFPEWKDEEKLLAYGVCGGIPQYLLYLSQYATLEEAVQEEFLSVSGHLQEEPSNLMLQELREPAVYNSILTAIAHGATRLNEIAQAVGKESGQVNFYLSNLKDLEIIEKKKPVEETATRRTIYQIKDNLYRFWYRFIPECTSLIAMGLGKRAWKEKIAPDFPEYFGHIFEDICLQYVQYLVATEKIPELYTQYGSWWGTDPQKHRGEEIDLVCTSDTDVLCGECKWRKEPVGYPVLATLKERGALIQKGRQMHYILFSKSGFTAGLQEQLDTDEAALISLKNILETGKV